MSRQPLTSGFDMCIIIVVPTRNVYVSEDDLDLFAEATEIAGGLSAAVLEALRSYVDRHHRAAGGFDEIELELQNDGIDHRVTFMGRRLIHIRRPDPEGTRIDTVYLTAKHQFAVATKIQRRLPDWTTGHEHIWSDPETWNREFWIAGDKTMAVYPSLDKLREADPNVAERAEATVKIPPFEVLDI